MDDRRRRIQEQRDMLAGLYWSLAVLGALALLTIIADPLAGFDPQPRNQERNDMPPAKLFTAADLLLQLHRLQDSQAVDLETLTVWWTPPEGESGNRLVDFAAVEIINGKPALTLSHCQN